MEIIPFVHNYAWGKVGEESEVAKLFKANKSDYEIMEEPVAELWMGTHPSGPATLKSDGTELNDLIKNNPEYLGDSRQIFGDALPFLFKVLSIQKALSIQAHPSKALAEELHRKFPNIYKDSNHKPELAIALTPFQAMCGFRQPSEILTFFADYPELKVVLGEQVYLDYVQNQSEENLRNCFQALMLCPEETIKLQMESVLKKFSKCSSCEKKTKFRQILENLNTQFPGDVGCFAPVFLNVLDLTPGQAIFLGPDLPHAYISGDCIECMACSDNVVRAGLTPKFKDVETLCFMLDCKGGRAEDFLFEPEVESEFSQVFRPPVPDFAVAKITIPKSLENFDLPPRSTASILICIEGNGKLGNSVLHRGSVIFLPAKSQETITEITEDLLIFQAMANV